MMRGRLAGLASCVALAAAAVWSHSSRAPAPSSSPDFAQGTYRTLIEAENRLRRGDRPGALESFQIAAARASRCGRSAVFRRVRNRIGAAGKDLFGTGDGGGWPFLAFYALWSEDFNVASHRVEAWCLGQGATMTSFDYPLVVSKGRTAWGLAPIRIPFWLLRPLGEWVPLERYPQLHRGIRANEIPPEASWGWIYPIQIRNTGLLLDSTLVLDVARAGCYRWYPSFHDQARLDKPIPLPSESSAGRPIPYGITLLDRILVLGDGPLPPFVLSLRHTYEPL